MKELAIEKVNREFEEQNSSEPAENAAPVLDEVAENYQAELPQEEEQAEKPRAKRRFKVSVIGVQLAVVVLLLGVIVFSNIFMEQSGIATFSILSSRRRASRRITANTTALRPHCPPTAKFP